MQYEKLLSLFQELEQKTNQEQDSKEQESYKRVVASAKVQKSFIENRIFVFDFFQRLIEAVKYSIVSLQLAKVKNLSK